MTSVSLAPLPLVTFSLRLPSRLAAALDAPTSSPESATSSTTPKDANIVLHYLSSAQTPLASAFAKALPAPTPSNTTSSSTSPSPFSTHHHSLSKEGIPILGGCIGAISCRVLGSIPLSAEGLQSVGFSTGSLGEDGTGYEGEATSELYVAEVVRVEESLPLPPLVQPEYVLEGVGLKVDEAEGKGLPLVYHDQRYCGVGSIGRP